MKNNATIKNALSCAVFLSVIFFLHTSCNSRNNDISDKENVIRVMSYNTHYGKGMDGVFSLENIAEVIKKANPDIVGLQEISDSLMAQKLGDLTGMKAVFGPSLGRSNGYGDAILSKYSFEWVDNLSIPSASSSRYQAMAVDVDLSNMSEELGKIRVINTHFDWLRTIGSKHARLATIDVIEEAFFKDQDILPSILTADLNSTPDSKEIDKLESHGWVNYNDGNTYHTHNSINPDKQIDYILYRTKNKWKVKNFFVMYGEESSDHLPVVIDIIIR